MTPFIKRRPAAVFATLLCGATSANAEASLDTTADITDVMEACLVVTLAHDYDAEGQQIDIPWRQITSRSASFGGENGPPSVTANVFKSSSSANSYCDILLDDADLAQEALDLFMTDRTSVVDGDYEGICVDETFLIVYATGADGTAASAVGAQGYITIHNRPTADGGVCSESSS